MERQKNIWLNNMADRFSRLICIVAMITIASTCCASGYGTANLSAETTAKKIEKTPVTCAVIAFDCPKDDPASTQLASAVESLLIQNLSNSKIISLVERDRTDLALKELSLNLSWQTSPEDALKIGKLVGADIGLVGSILQNNSKRFLIAKLLDLNTSRVIDVTILPIEEKNIEKKVTELTDFVLSANPNAKNVKQKVFLGIGGFEDLSINTSHANLGQQLSAYLQKSVLGSSSIVLERSMVLPVLNEAILKRSGLIQNADNKSSPLAAFILVDGIYQSFRDNKTKISMVLRIQKIGHARRVVNIEAQPGAPLYKQILSAVIDTINNDLPAKPDTSAKKESQAHLARGKERSRLVYMNTSYPRLGGRLGGYLRFQEKEKRLKNIKDAIAAFESAILLDPDCYEAKLMLGICLCDIDIAEYDKARNIFRTIIAAAKEKKFTDIAEFRLGYSYAQQAEAEKQQDRRKASQQTAFDLLAAFLKKIKNPDHRTFVMSPMQSLDEQLYRADKRTLEETLQFQKTRILNGCELAKWRVKQKYYIHVYRLSSYYYAESARFLKFDKAAAAEYYRGIIELVKKEHPRLAPYFVATYAIKQKPDQANFEMIETLLTNIRQDPERVLDYNSFCSNSVMSAMGWAISKDQYDLCILAGQMVDDAIDKGILMGGSDKDSARTVLAHAYMQKQQWDKALKMFQKVKGNEVPMVWSGPWGQNTTIISIKKAVIKCKLNLGHKDLDDHPIQKLEAKKLFAIAPSGVFDVDVNNNIWFVKKGILSCYDQTGKKLLAVGCPRSVKSEASCIDIGNNKIWFGTRQDGLYSYDIKAWKFQSYTTENGLPLNNITSLNCVAKRVWVGFGKGESGAVGYIDIPNQTFIGLMPKLENSVENSPHYGTLQVAPRTSPPKHLVSGLIQTDPNYLWLSVRRKGLQRYSLKDDKWDTASALVGFNRQYGRAISDNADLVSCVTASTDIVAVGSANKSKSRSSGDYRIGGIAIYRVADNTWKSISLSEGLPKNNIYSLALDGNNLWAGGRGFVALIDIKLNRVVALLKLDNEYTYVRTIKLMGKDVVFSAGSDLHLIEK